MTHVQIIHHTHESFFLKGHHTLNQNGLTKLVNWPAEALGSQRATSKGTFCAQLHMLDAHYEVLEKNMNKQKWA